MFYFIGNRGPFLIDLIKAVAFQSTPALHTCLGLDLACLLEKLEEITHGGLQPAGIWPTRTALTTPNTFLVVYP